ncbi:MAG: Flp pilus assembly complex ATPase component TadA [Actinomycetota bacterium]|nr:Flp pilus assembly complex ATPase component TadA [Actinomycetota bacterium]
MADDKGMTFGSLLSGAGGPALDTDVRRLRRRIGDVLLDAGVLNEEQLAHALKVQQATTPRQRLGRIIVDSGMATEQQVAEAMGTVLGLEVVDLSRTALLPDLVRSIPRNIAERSGIVLISRSGDHVRLATHDPTNVLALDDVRSYTGARQITVTVATESHIRETINRTWALADGAQLATVLDQHEASFEAEDLGQSTDSSDDAPTVRLVGMLLTEAVRARASDVHIEPQRDALRVRYRVDGVLRDAMTVPRGAGPSVVSRLKIMCGLDIAERRRPQDGRSRLVVDGASIDVRVSTLPALHGEKVVIRLLMRADDVPTLDRIGLAPDQLSHLLTALETPQGLVLITGPTGSGKTSTLYAGVAQTMSPERNVVTLEDPVEVELAGITQVQISEKAGLTFSLGLRSVLRQDPDIVLVGEIRDTETAELAARASLTGHLVLSTLHANSASSAVSRMVDMGVEPFLVASSLTCVVAQRLVRRPCRRCAQPCQPAPELLLGLGVSPELLAAARPVRGHGCADCANSGYSGRLGVFEVLPVTDEVRHALLTDPTETSLERAARAIGVRSLRESGLLLASAGGTTYEEVARVTAR